MILFLDVLFPSKYARWRIEEIKAFIDRGDTDFLISKLDAYDGISYSVDYEEMKDYFNLEKYNILIFDPKYNYLNKYNTRIDGTKCNGKSSKYSFLFTKFLDFDIARYSLFYHMFLSSYRRFNLEYPRIAPTRQFIHLYPGGGYSSATTPLASVSRNVNLICTQPDVYARAKSLKFENCIDVYGSTSLPKLVVPKIKPKNTSTLRVCFSSMGNSDSKGGNLFCQTVDAYKKAYPLDDVQFFFVGSTFKLSNKPANITFVAPMSQHQLSKFYNDSVDILVSCETGAAFNGWPLGIDAAIQGTVLIGTDVHNRNAYFKYDDGMMFIVQKNSYLAVVDSIKKLHDDRSLLQTMARNIQTHSIQLFSYNNQQEKIFSFIENTIVQTPLKTYRTVCPEYEYENYSYTIKNKSISLMNSSNLEIIEKDFPLFIINSIKEKKGITVARYNDGEWIALLKIKDHSLYQIHSRKWDVMGQRFVDTKMLPIIKGKIDYYLGIASEVMKKEYMVRYIMPYLNDVKLFDGGLFARMSIDGSIKQIITELKNRNVIVVGPKYLEKMNKYFNFIHIVTSERFVWNQYDNIYKKAIDKINESENPVIVYACSFVAKVLIDTFYKMFGTTITQLDVGAAFDLYCGVNSRPWHSQMENTI